MALEDEVKRDFATVIPLVEGIFLWGSQAEGHAHEKSDVDVCVVAGPNLAIESALRAAWTSPGMSSRYDVHVFEELPLYLKAEVLERGVLAATRDELALSEYLRHFRKVWADQAHRNRPNDEDMARILAARRARG